MSKKNVRISETLCSEKEMSDIQRKYCNRYISDWEIDASVRQAKYEHFAKLLAQKAAQKNYVFSENGAVEYASTGSFLVDFNARASEFRNASDEVVMDAAVKAYAENPVDFVKLMFQTGDIRCGKGERHAFNTCMDWLVAEHPAVALEVLELIPEYTRWDYLIRQTISENADISSQATQLVTEQFKKDVEAAEKAKEAEPVNLSLLAKWMPSLQTKKEEDKKIVRHLLRSLHMQEREYRHTLSMLRAYLNVVEKALSAKDYDAIDMEKLSSKQQLRYAACFRRVMAEKRHAYIQAVLAGEKKMNTAVLNPLEILHEYVRGVNGKFVYNEDLEALWSLLPDKTGQNGNTLVIRDGSGSMTAPIGQGSSATMLEAATAMAVYCAQHLTGAFQDTFITFSSRPEVVKLSGCETLADKIKLLYQYDDCSNTDIEATFDLILDTAVNGGLSQEALPAYLMILSDMEFDAARGARIYDWKNGRYLYAADRDTLFATIRQKWQDAGYDMPTLVFWQLNGKRTIYPEIDEKNGIIFLSGFSTNELELVMAGQYEAAEEITTQEQTVNEETGEVKRITRTRTERRVLTPFEQLKRKLADPRYDAVEAAVRRGLAQARA